MAHLTDTLEKFARQELALSELKRICLEIAQGNGPPSAEIRHELAGVRDAGILRPSEYATLEFSLAGAVLARPAAATASPSFGTQRDDGSEDATVIRPRSHAFQPAGSDEGNEDVTVTRPPFPVTDDESEDETVIRQPLSLLQEPTIRPSSGHEIEPPPKTQDNDAGERNLFLGASHDDDRTVVVGSGTDDDDKTAVVSSKLASDDFDATTLNPVLHQDATTANRPIRDDDPTTLNATAG